MHIRALHLYAYRSYETLAFTPKAGLNVLVGENAAGKTNILESLFLLALGRSHRTRHDGELIHTGQQGAAVRAVIAREGGEHTLACKLYRDGRRTFLIDKTPLRRSGELMGFLRVVMFSPEDLSLVKSGPGQRRRFMDMGLSQSMPRYYYLLQLYNAALRQRNALLKSKAEDAALYAPWEEQIVSAGTQIMQARKAYISRLDQAARQVHETLCQGKEGLSLAYAPNVQGAYAPVLQNGRKRDILRGSTDLGPHRDDVRIMIDGESARAFGSQGQQRTAALSLKLAEIALCKEEGADLPVLLLDDVLSELDGARQKALVQAIAQCQTFLTCTRLAGLADVSGAAVFRVENGAVVREGDTI